MIDSTLAKVWREQVAYNLKVRKVEHPENYEYWMKQYLLGAISEVNEILQEINWKIHRRGKPLNKNNLAMELADLTKFVLSMWEWSGFTPEQMLEFVSDKNEELASQWKQDFEFAIPPNSNVLICDIDGTIGNWRKAFQSWLEKNDIPSDYDTTENLSMEIDIKLPYKIYHGLKEKFEAEGGYSDLPVYEDGVDVVRFLTTQQSVIAISYTARPASTISRIWLDTWKWFDKVGLGQSISELRIGSESRINRAVELREQGHQVIMLEDDPSLALRAANAGLQVVMRSQNYNSGIVHPNITRTSLFRSREILSMFSQQELR